MTQLEVAHANAGLDLLRALTAPALTVYEGVLPPNVTSLAPPWVLVYTAVDWPGGDPDNGLDQASLTCVTSWYCYCSGTTGTAVLAVTGRVRGALLDVRPTIAGRVCDRIEQTASEPPRPHEGTGTSVLTALSIYELRTRPA